MRKIVVDGIRFELSEMPGTQIRLFSARCPLCRSTLSVRPVGLRRVLEEHVAGCIGPDPTVVVELVDDPCRYPSANLTALIRAQEWVRPGGKRYFQRCRRR